MTAALSQSILGRECVFADLEYAILNLEYAILNRPSEAAKKFAREKTGALTISPTLNKIPSEVRFWRSSVEDLGDAHGQFKNSIPRLAYLGRAAAGLCRDCVCGLVRRPDRVESYPPLFEIASAERGRFPLAISPATIDLGMLHPGESAEAVLTLRNLGSRQITVSRIEISCPCIQVMPDHLRIEVGAVREIALKFVPDEPGFVGSLGVDVIGRDKKGRCLFQARVNVQVEAASADRSSHDCPHVFTSSGKDRP